MLQINPRASSLDVFNIVQKHFEFLKYLKTLKGNVHESYLSIIYKKQRADTVDGRVTVDRNLGR